MSTRKANILVSYQKLSDENFKKTIMKNSCRLRQKSNDIEDVYKCSELTYKRSNQKHNSNNISLINNHIYPDKKKYDDKSFSYAKLNHSKDSTATNLEFSSKPSEIGPKYKKSLLIDILKNNRREKEEKKKEENIIYPEQGKLNTNNYNKSTNTTYSKLGNNGIKNLKEKKQQNKETDFYLYSYNIENDNSDNKTYSTNNDDILTNKSAINGMIGEKLKTNNINNIFSNLYYKSLNIHKRKNNDNLMNLHTNKTTYGDNCSVNSDIVYSNNPNNLNKLNNLSNTKQINRETSSVIDNREIENIDKLSQQSNYDNYTSYLYRKRKNFVTKNIEINDNNNNNNIIDNNNKINNDENNNNLTSAYNLNLNENSSNSKIVKGKIIYRKPRKKEDSTNEVIVINHNKKEENYEKNNENNVRKTDKNQIKCIHLNFDDKKESCTEKENRERDRRKEIIRARSKELLKSRSKERETEDIRDRSFIRNKNKKDINKEKLKEQEQKNDEIKIKQINLNSQKEIIRARSRERVRQRFKEEKEKEKDKSKDANNYSPIRTVANVNKKRIVFSSTKDNIINDPSSKSLLRADKNHVNNNIDKKNFEKNNINNKFIIKFFDDLIDVANGIEEKTIFEVLINNLNKKYIFNYDVNGENAKIINEDSHFNYCFKYFCIIITALLFLTKDEILYKYYSIKTHLLFNQYIYSCLCYIGYNNLNSIKIQNFLKNFQKTTQKISIIQCVSSIVKLLFNDKNEYAPLNKALKQLMLSGVNETVNNIIKIINECLLFCYNQKPKTNYNDFTLFRRRDGRDPKILNGNFLMTNLDEDKSFNTKDNLPDAPFIKTNMKKKFCLVLDIDETISHSLKLNFGYYFIMRPGVLELLNEISQFFEIIIFTSSPKIYADNIIDKIDAKGNLISHRLYKTHVFFERGKSVKNLNLIGRDINKIIFVDNLKCNAKYNPKNLYLIPTWTDDIYDDKLYKLKDKLIYIYNSGKYNDDITKALVQ